jgi:hypothetical protein
VLDLDWIRQFRLDQIHIIWSFSSFEVTLRVSVKNIFLHVVKCLVKTRRAIVDILCTNFMFWVRKLNIFMQKKIWIRLGKHRIWTRSKNFKYIESVRRYETYLLLIMKKYLVSGFGCLRCSHILSYFLSLDGGGCTLRWYVAGCWVCADNVGYFLQMSFRTY